MKFFVHFFAKWVKNNYLIWPVNPTILDKYDQIVNNQMSSILKNQFCKNSHFGCCLHRPHERSLIERNEHVLFVRNFASVTIVFLMR